MKINEISEISEIFDRISEVKFHNLKYRTYCGFIDDYIIASYPYAIYVYKKIKPINNHYDILTDLEYGTGNYIKLIFNCHNNDFLINKNNYSPCKIYEKISGYSINGEDNYNENQEYWINNRLKFDMYIINIKRKKKLLNLNNNENR